VEIMTVSSDLEMMPPPMGWNSWHVFGCDVDEYGIGRTADALVASGLRSAGYDYLIVDDGWYAPRRASNGSLRADPLRFPSGIGALADHLHTKGLRLGLYQTPAERTCAQRAGLYPGATGSRGHERQDAETFAKWGVDYLKYDWCSPEGTGADQHAAFTRMRDALAATGRPIVFAINPNSCHADNTGATLDWSGVANSWRTTGNLAATWSTGRTDDAPPGVLDVLDITASLADRTGPGRFNDPDMLQLGMPVNADWPALTWEETKTHFGMWVLLAAPLILAADVPSIPAAALAVLTSPELVAVNQDRLGCPARLAGRGPDREVWVKPLVDGSCAVGLLNRADQPQEIAVDSDRLVPGWRGRTATATDLWTGRPHPVDTGLTIEVAAHGLALYRIAGLLDG
jgi:alpha-galactosidase